jgi:hypothetical protein
MNFAIFGAGFEIGLPRYGGKWMCTYSWAPCRQSHGPWLLPFCAPSYLVRPKDTLSKLSGRELFMLMLSKSDSGNETQELCLNLVSQSEEGGGCGYGHLDMFGKRETLTPNP